ncbi:MAG: NlpC/P60 family protein [Paludibacteraceae bacterium]|nr:NlpC/P60 family protein [Paludibacteraceae bacterium]
MKKINIFLLTLALTHHAAAMGQDIANTDSMNAVGETDTITTITENETLRDSISTFAEKFLGKPYRGGGKGPNVFDCSGFTRYVYMQFGYNLNASASSQYIEVPHIDLKKIQKGDLLFFKGRNAKEKRVGHVAMVSNIDEETGSITIIHAALNGGVRFDQYPDNRYYRERYVGAGRVLAPIEAIKLDTATNKQDSTSNVQIAIQDSMATPKTQEQDFKDTCIIHTIKKGDNLYRLSKEYNVSIEEIKESNNLKSTNLKIGNRLIIKKGKD